MATNLDRAGPEDRRAEVPRTVTLVPTTPGTRMIIRKTFSLNLTNAGNLEDLYE